jgi:hypothetical protein
MKAKATQAAHSRSKANRRPQLSPKGTSFESSETASFEFKDNRPEAITQRTLQALPQNSPHVRQGMQLQDMANSSPHVRHLARMQEMIDNSPKIVAQRKQMEDISGVAIQKKEHTTGLPDNLKAGLENLAGMSMDDIRVHYNSSKPAALQALAYTQGTDVHIGPGQERHLPHEAWHAVQQKQGRVVPTVHMKLGRINDDQELEREADAMGREATHRRATQSAHDRHHPDPVPLVNTRPPARESRTQGTPQAIASSGPKVVQRILQVGREQYANGTAVNKRWQERLNAMPQVLAEYYAGLAHPESPSVTPREKAFDAITQTPRYQDWQTLNDLVCNWFMELADSPKPYEFPSWEKAYDAYKENMPEDERGLCIQLWKEIVKDAEGELYLSFWRAMYENEDAVEIANPVAHATSWMPDLEQEEKRQTPDEPAPRRLTETQTRMGFEVELGGMFKVVFPADKTEKQAAIATVNSVINHTLATYTLASTDKSAPKLEFLIDDFNEAEGTVQFEFRTTPFLRNFDPTGLRKQISSAITCLPLRSFQREARPTDIVTAMNDSGWSPTAEFRTVAALLVPTQTKLSVGNPPRLIQHVTHSIPLAGFLQLSPSEREFLIPGTKNAKTIIDLILFFYDKLMTTVTKDGTIKITTTSRGKTNPNIKTPLDVLIGMLEPKTAQQLIEMIHSTMPRSVALQSGETGTIGALHVLETLPNIAGLNTEGGKAYLSGEEKPRAPLFDPKRKDIRVLVEHRGTGGSGPDLVRAVNLALKGKTEELGAWQKIFSRLDNVRGDPIFVRWFRPSAKD